MPNSDREQPEHGVEGDWQPILAAEPGDDTGDLIDRYRLTGIHSEGGLGRVWLARDPKIGRDVALKELLSEQAAQPQARARFMREARITGQLDHPNIVPVYELGERGDDGRPFYAMRFVRGPTLSDSIRADFELHHGSRAWPRGRNRLVRALCSVGNAIGHAHSRGIVHRDLKPDNIVLGDHGELILLDWGLAKRIPDATERETPAAEPELFSTHVGDVVGTIAYMSPEQADGQESDERTDIYGLGAILFEVLTGRAPHGGDDAVGVLREIIEGETPRARSLNPGAPSALDAICQKAMAKRPEDRYAHADELVLELERWLNDEPVSVQPENLFTALARLVRRHQSLACAGAIALMIVVVITTLSAIRLGAAADRERGLSERLMRSFARSAALAVGRDIEYRWDILETAAADEELRAALASDRGDDTRLQEWLGRLSDEQQQLTKTLSWLVQGPSGIQRARIPYATSIGQSFAFRDYFHGLGKDLDPSPAVDTSPLREAHRSVVFRSTVTDNLMVAFSVPIWDSKRVNREVIGVLAMTVELGGFDFEELGLDENQLVVLIDTLAAWEGRRGLVLQHAELARRRLLRSTDDRASVPLYYVSEDQLVRFREFRRARRGQFPERDRPLMEARPTETELLRASGLDQAYHDPVDGDDSGQWLAAFEPVLVTTPAGKVSDTGWMVIVQERGTGL